MKKLITILPFLLFLLLTSFMCCYAPDHDMEYYACMYLKNESYDTVKVCMPENHIKYCPPSDSIGICDYQLEDTMNLEKYYYLLDWYKEWVKADFQLFISQQEIPKEQLQMIENYKLYYHPTEKWGGDMAIALIITDSMLQEKRR